MNAVMVRRLFALALLAYGLYDLAHLGRGTLLDGVDLAIHETGHLVFGPFGEFVGFAGGTLFQLLMPLAFVAYFARRGDGHAASVALWWVGQNCGHIAYYVADARAMALPLVGGGEHDWNYLLGELRLLQSDQAIAHAIVVTGVLLVIGSSAWGLLTAGPCLGRGRGAARRGGELIDSATLSSRTCPSSCAPPDCSSSRTSS